MRHTLNVVLFLSLPVCQHAGVADHPDVAGAQRLFESWIRGQMAYRQLPGIAVGVVYDQELVWAKGFGYADVESRTPVTPATKFRMASHSKLFTATAIMQLRDAGKLRLDDPVSKYLPWFKIQPAEPDDPPVTIEELLTHSAGLPREAGSHWITYDFPTEEQVLAGGPLEVFQSWIRARGNDRGGGLRREVRRLCPETYFPAAGDER